MRVLWYCVGGVSEHETLGNVECYDPETDRWVVDVIPQMRYRRSGVGVAVLQGLLFAIGGYLEGKTSTDAVECYNPRTKRFVLDKGGARREGRGVAIERRRGTVPRIGPHSSYQSVVH